jgi:hypothetical protein
MVPFGSLFTGLLWLGFLIAAGIAILAYRSYQNLRPLRQSVTDASARVEAAIRERSARIQELSAFLVRQGGWRSPPPVSATGVISSYRNSCKHLDEMREFVDRLPELKESSEYKDLMRWIDLSAANIWQRIESYHLAFSNYELARASFPALFLGFADQQATDWLDLRALRALRANAVASIPEIDGADGRNFYYVVPGGVPKGPISAEDLRSLIAAGIIPPEAMIADANSREWRQINHL